MAAKPLPYRDSLVVGGLVLPTYTVATLPTNRVTGTIVYCSDGNAGQESLVLYDGTNWVSLATGATAAAS